MAREIHLPATSEGIPGTLNSQPAEWDDVVYGLA